MSLHNGEWRARRLQGPLRKLSLLPIDRRKHRSVEQDENWRGNPSTGAARPGMAWALLPVLLGLKEGASQSAMVFVSVSNSGLKHCPH